ncbi:MAG: FlgD immunoglobulin-like domain containing protein [Candidatus Latescibacteria bacterium]|nr:FlgD immunoglobulin-like domain containing protein [Candidatus Latescibacterota bacterium]
MRLRVYNALGQHVKTLIDASLPAGERVATWDGTDLASQPVGTGTYIYELAADQVARRRWMLLLR